MEIFDLTQVAICCTRRVAIKPLVTCGVLYHIAGRSLHSQPNYATVVQTQSSGLCNRAHLIEVTASEKLCLNAQAISASMFQNKNIRGSIVYPFNKVWGV